MTTNERRRGLVAIVTVAFLYGSWGLMAREADKMFGLNTQAGFRQLVGLAIIGVFLLIYKPRLRLARNEIKYVVGLCLCWAPSGIFWTYAANRTTVANAVFLLYAGAIITAMVLGTFVHRENVTVTKAIGLVCAVAGLAAFSGPLVALNFGIVTGLICGVLNGFNSSLSKHVKDIPRLTVLTYAYVVGILIGVATIAASGEEMIKLWDTQAFVVTILYSIGVLLVGVLLLYGFARFDVNAGNIILSTELLVAAVLGYLVLSETPTSSELVGGLLTGIAAVVSCIPSRTIWQRSQ